MGKRKTPTEKKAAEIVAWLKTYHGFAKLDTLGVDESALLALLGQHAEVARHPVDGCSCVAAGRRTIGWDHRGDLVQCIACGREWADYYDVVTEAALSFAQDCAWMAKCYAEKRGGPAKADYNRAQRRLALAGIAVAVGAPEAADGDAERRTAAGGTEGGGG